MTLLLAAIAISALIGFVVGVVYQSDNGPDYDE
jgi:hypothetical protein